MCTASVVATAALVMAAAEPAGPRNENQNSAAGQTNRSANEQQQAVSLAERANEMLGLTASEVITLDINSTPNLPINAQLPIAGEMYTLALEPHSVRAEGYRLLAQVEGGEIIEVDPGPERMLKGVLEEAPGSMVAGGLLEDGLHAVIRMPDGEQIWIEPLLGRVVGAGPNHYIMYNGNDVLHPNGTCGVDAAFIKANPPLVAPNSNPPEGPEGSFIYCTDLAIDADREYYVQWGSNVLSVQNRINLVITTVNFQYLNECDIQHAITTIIVRTAEPDPYFSTNASFLLSEFQNEWNSNQAGIPRDVAHLFTGKFIDGGTIGIAFLSQICNLGAAYSLVQSDCCGSLACATDLSAHELGHNWSASHCACPSNTMNPTITCVNVHHPASINQIINFRNSRPCLSACAATPLPFLDEFPSTTVDASKWAINLGAFASTFGINEPSAPNALHLRGTPQGGAQVRTARMNGAGLAQINLSYYYQRKGLADQPEFGDDLVVEYFNSLGTWVEIHRYPGNGPAMTEFVQANATLPNDAKHNELRLRFRCISFEINFDDWFVDNVSITAITAPTNDNCADAPILLAGTHNFTTLGATTDGPDEPGACNFNGSSQITNDIWYRYAAQCTGTATVSLCGTSYNAKIAAYNNVCLTTAGGVLACSDDFCGTSPQISFPVVFGNLYRIRIGGFNGASGSGTMMVTCGAAAPCPPDVNNSGTVDINDLLMVIGAWGPCPAPCPPDIDDDGTVDIDDLLAVIGAWGPCP